MSVAASSVQEQVATCTFCMKMCRFACPVVEASKVETHTPFSKVQAYYHTLFNNEPMPEADSSLAFLCTHCGLCTEHCKHENPVHKILTEMRARYINSKLLNHEIRAGLEKAKLEYETKLSQAYDILRRELSDNDSIALSEINEKSLVFVPDYEAIRHSLKPALRIFKNLQLKRPGVKILREPIDSVFFFYQVGEIRQAEKVHENLVTILDLHRGAKFIFESEEQYYGYNSLFDSLHSDRMLLLHNEVDILISLKHFQMQPSSFSLRLSGQAYIDNLKVNHPQFVEAVPGGKKQSPAADAEFFGHLFPSIYREMLSRKWSELLQQPGDIIFTSFFDYVQMLKYKPSSCNRKIHYLMRFIQG